MLQLSITCAFSSFLSMRVSNEHAGSISRHLLFFLSITVTSGQLSSRVLSFCVGKSHKILQSFRSWLVYIPFLCFIESPFSYSFQPSILTRQRHVSLVCTSSALVLSNLKQCVQLCNFSSTTYITDGSKVFSI